MERIIRALEGGEENSPVILQVFSVRALESCAIFFLEVRETSRI
jgi:hypothetical protein